MAARYSTIKSLKFAKIGTIMPWGGDGSDGFSPTNIPKGWIVCNGASLSASRYPLLASIIGNSYGGTNFTGQFPEYSGSFRVPNISARVLMDLEPSMLNEPKYLYNQYDAKNVLVTLVKDDGFTTPINTLVLSESDIVFSLQSIDSGIINAVDNIGAVSTARKPGTYGPIAARGGTGEGALFTVVVSNAGTPSAPIGGAVNISIDSGGQGYRDNDVLSFFDVLLGNGGAPALTFQVNNGTPAVNTDLTFSGKMTDIVISNPDFNTSIYTIPRKLGINHMPAHQHPSTYPYAQASGTGPMEFRPSGITRGGTVSGDCEGYGTVNCSLTNPTTVPTWQDGFILATYYGDEAAENTMPTTDKFLYFPTTGDYDYSKVPSNSAPQRSILGTPYTTTFGDIPNKNHQQDAWTGMFPKPSATHGNRRNYFGLSTVAANPPANPELISGFAVPNVPLQPGLTKFRLPIGTDLGTTFDAIVPFMWVFGSGTGIPPGSQVLSIVRVSGTTVATYVYEIQISNITTDTASGTETVTFRHGTYPTTINNDNGGLDPTSSSFTSHGHGTFDIAMTRGTLNAPPTFPVNNVAINNVYPESLKNALNIVINTSAPSVNITYIMRAY
jgi:hypothetical protein